LMAIEYYQVLHSLISDQVTLLELILAKFDQ